jgi:hypothetical protein
MKKLFLILFIISSNYIFGQNLGGFVRNNIIPITNSAPIILRISFDFRLLNSSAPINSFGFFQVGEQLGADSNPLNPSPINPKLNANFSFSSTATGKFRIRSTSLSAPNGGTEFNQDFENTQKLTWIINNSNSRLNYINPAGVAEQLDPKSWDLFVANVLVFHNEPVIDKEASIRDFKFGLRENNTPLAIKFDDLIVEDLSSSIVITSLNKVETKKEELIVYKNDAVLNIQFSSLARKEAELKLFSISGSLISAKKWILNSGENENYFFTTKLSSGIYFVNLSGYNLNLSKKIIIN